VKQRVLRERVLDATCLDTNGKSLVLYVWRYAFVGACWSEKEEKSSTLQCAGRKVREELFGTILE